MSRFCSLLRHATRGKTTWTTTQQLSFDDDGGDDDDGDHDDVFLLPEIIRALYTVTDRQSELR